MDELERKLRAYYDSIEPDEAFIERLKALEHSPQAEPRPRRVRRYLLPAAAAVMAVVALGAGWTYLRASLPGNAPEPMSAAEEIPAADHSDDNYVNQPPAEAPAEEPAAASEPAASAEGPEQEVPAAEAPEPPAAEAVTFPVQQGSPPAQTPQMPAQNAPQPPEPEPQAPPEDDPPEVDPDPPEVDPDPPADDPDPPAEDDPEPPEPVTLSADFFSEGSCDFVSITNTATGETVTFDMTGLAPAPIRKHGAGLDPNAPIPSESDSDKIGYLFQRSAFGCEIIIRIERDAAGHSWVLASPIT